MVLLGMNRVAVRDGSITRKVMFRAAAHDAAKVRLRDRQRPAGSRQLGRARRNDLRGATRRWCRPLPSTRRAKRTLRADLFGEVKLNFVSETLPLDRLADAAKVALVQRNSPARRARRAAPCRPRQPAAPPRPRERRRMMLRDLAPVLEDLHDGPAPQRSACGRAADRASR